MSRFKRWRNTILGTLVVLSGVGAAALTVLARRGGDWELTRLGAVASIVFAVLIVIFVVPPLARNARAEAARLDLAFQVTGGGARAPPLPPRAGARAQARPRLLHVRAAPRQGRAARRADVRGPRARLRH